jgi:hypothetical protein
LRPIDLENRIDCAFVTTADTRRTAGSVDDAAEAHLAVVPADCRRHGPAAARTPSQAPASTRHAQAASA